MRFATVGRYSTLGVYVCFRLEGTMELLWRAPMKIIPGIDHQVGALIDGSDVETWYKVEGYRWEFEEETAADFGDPPQSFVAEHANFGVCCIVSEVV